MGSCLSKKEREKGKPPSSSHSCCRDPPPDSPQEEKVKEVLSETPKVNLNKVTTVTKDDGINNNNKSNDGKEKEKEKEVKVFQDRSEDTSELYSVSETLSVSTPVPETEKEEKKKRSDRVEEEHQLKRRADRSPARYQKKRSVSGELHPSPAKKVSDHRGVGIGCRSGRSSSPNSVGRTHSARDNRVSACEKFRRDHGERSERRSVSPASKRASPSAVGGGQCRSLSSASRANGRCSPHRIQARVPANGDVPSNGGGRDGDDVAEKESLENPLVSLECFIFL